MIGAYINIEKKTFFDYLIWYLLACGIGANIGFVIFLLSFIIN